jgi:hypothetical protein
MTAKCGEMERLLRPLHRRRLQAQAGRILQRALPAAALLLGMGALLRLGWQAWGSHLPLAPPAVWMVLAAATLGGMLAAHHWLRNAALPDRTLPTSVRLADDLLHADALLLSAWEAERRSAAPGAGDAVVLARAHRALPDWRARASGISMHPRAQGLPGLLLVVALATLLLLLTNPTAAPGDGHGSAAAGHTGRLPSAAALDQLREAISRAALSTGHAPDGADLPTPPSNGATSPTPGAEDLSGPRTPGDAHASASEGRASLPPQLGQRGGAAPTDTEQRATGDTRAPLGTVASDGAGRESAPRRQRQRHASEDLTPDRGRKRTEPDTAPPIGLPRHLAATAVAALGEGDGETPTTAIGQSEGSRQTPPALAPITRPPTAQAADARLSPRLRALLSAYHASLRDEAAAPSHR